MILPMGDTYVVEDPDTTPATVLPLVVATGNSTKDDGMMILPMGDTYVVENPATTPVHLSVTPEGQHKARVGSDVTLTCIYHAGNVTDTYWRDTNGTAIRDLNNTQITESEGVLTISAISLDQAGNYTCFTNDDSHSASVEVVVYIMPTYFR